MQVVLFCHSLVSCWNHGNAHFLRGVVRELQARGHGVRVLEPVDGWSRQSLVREQGLAALADNEAACPAGCVETWHEAELDLDAALDGADLVLVHEWNPPALVERLGRHRVAGGRHLLLFHDTHHRAVTSPAEMARYRLEGYDGVLAFGAALREIYLRRGWARRVWTWHEAADLHVFRPMPGVAKELDLIWIGNWGDEERTAELQEYLLQPVVDLGLRAAVHGVRYPDPALRWLLRRGIEFRGWLPNHRVPQAFAAARATVHVPRRPYARALPGIPTIRVFEALACGIPLVSAPWDDVEELFTPGEDFLMAQDGRAMRTALTMVLNEPALAAELTGHGLRTIERRHSCAHRVDELLAICAAIAPERFAAERAPRRAVA
jgi:spore maturation protein CgeB